MKLIGLRLVIGGLALLLCWVERPQTVRAASAGAQANLLQREVSSFVVDSLPALDAVLLLAQQERIPLGIEYVSREILDRALSFRMQNVTIGETLEAIFAEDPGYRWLVEDDVVVITHANEPPLARNVFRRILPEFTTDRVSMQWAGALLWMALFRELYPMPEEYGFAGTVKPGDPESLVGPLSLRKSTVRKVLNRIVSENRNAAWIVKVKPEHMNQMHWDGLWVIVEYQDPPRRYAETLRQMIFRWERPSSNKKTE